MVKVTEDRSGELERAEWTASSAAQPIFWICSFLWRRIRKLEKRIETLERPR